VAPVGVTKGKASFGTRFRRRTSAGSMPISRAKRSIPRSMAAVASGRPAPRYAAVGHVFVSTDFPPTSMFGIT
jgi:hypothetical protein